MTAPVESWSARRQRILTRDRWRCCFCDRPARYVVNLVLEAADDDAWASACELCVNRVEPHDMLNL